jgi:hypothetical protein
LVKAVRSFRFDMDVGEATRFSTKADENKSEDFV